MNCRHNILHNREYNNTKQQHAYCSGGCVLKFANNIELVVYGTLNITGAQNNYVVITSIHDNVYGETITGSSSSPAYGDWRGIYLNGTGSYHGKGNLDYCRIRYGGNTVTSNKANICFYSAAWNGSKFSNSISEHSQSYGIRIYDSRPTISYSNISNNLTHGIYAHITYIDSCSPYINYCVFNNNCSYGAYLDNVRLTSYTGNSCSSNGKNEFGINGQIKDTQVDFSSGTEAFPLSLINNVTINSGMVLNVTGGTLKSRTYYTTVAGNFYLKEGATLEIGSPDGINSSGSTGNIRKTGIRSFSNQANYVHNGTTLQVTGTGLPSQENSIKVKNSSNVSLTNNLLVNGTLYLANGYLLNTAKGNVTIADNGSINKETGSLSNPVYYSGTVNMVYSGTTGVTTGNELPANDIINNFTVNNSGGITLNKDIKVNGSLYLVSGT